MHSSTALPLAGSFRDPAGFVFVEEGAYKRVVAQAGHADYQRFMGSGLYAELAAARLIVPHVEEARGVETLILVPEQIPFISYPYEWCFSQLRDAALLTLDIQLHSLRRGMSLKDASAFNVQFRGARPVFIDTLSFEANAGGPWPAYDQFCRHFLAPLALMATRWDSFNQFLSASPEGLPLAMVSRLLPARTWFQPGLLMHIHLHARAQNNAAQGQPASTRTTPDRKAALAESLRSAIESLRPPRRSTAWSGYYEERSHYTPASEQFRREYVARTLLNARPELVFDLGANRGDYSRLTAELGFRCVAFEMDAACAETAYLEARRSAADLVLPLRMDLRNPSPGLGFHSRERMALHDRPRASMLLALAIIHHLRITGLAPFALISEYFAALGDHLLLEFVPKDDPMTALMLAHRTDIFDDFTLDGLRQAFHPLWELASVEPIPESPRTLCLFQLRSPAR
ncbi:MAG: hypothetical protein R2729_07970 [Bryobacteraceae bacterium]